MEDKKISKAGEPAGANFVVEFVRIPPIPAASRHSPNTLTRHASSEDLRRMHLLGGKRDPSRRWLWAGQQVIGAGGE